MIWCLLICVLLHLCDVETSLNVPHPQPVIYTITQYKKKDRPRPAASRQSVCNLQSISNRNVYIPSFIAASRRASMAASSLLASSPASSALMQLSTAVCPSLAVVLGSVVYSPMSSSSNSRRRRAHSASLSSDSAAVGKDVSINALGVVA